MISRNTMIIIDKPFTESSFPWLRYLQGTLRCLLSCSPWAQYSLCIYENYHRIITEYDTTRVRNCCLWKPWCSYRPKVIILWILLLPEVFSRVLPVFWSKFAISWKLSPEICLVEGPKIEISEKTSAKWLEEYECSLEHQTLSSNSSWARRSRLRRDIFFLRLRKKIFVEERESAL